MPLGPSFPEGYRYRTEPPSFLAPLTLLVGLILAVPAEAREILYLTNGRQIVVDRFWEEGDQIVYQKNGGTFGFPRRLLERVGELGGSQPDETDDAAEPEPSGFRNEALSQGLTEARQKVRAGDVEEAADVYRKTLSRAPDSVEARVELAELYLQRRDFFAAQTQLEQAKRLAPDDAEVRELLGDAYYGRGRTGLAIREWQKSLQISPNSGLLYKLKQALRENDDDIDFEEVNRPHFIIRYDGAVNESIGRAVAAALDEEYYNLSQELRFSPQAPIRITLYMHREFQDVTHAPSWASALNDGEIRIPIEGASGITPKLRRVLRHELTHSFVNARTKGNCPSWFHEGLAQLREGETRMDPYPRLRTASETGELLPLWSLEGRLLNYRRDKALLVYAQALAATEYITARRGREALVRILELLGDGQTMNDALKTVVGLDYQEFQTAWEADLLRYR